MKIGVSQARVKAKPNLFHILKWIKQTTEIHFRFRASSKIGSGKLFQNDLYVYIYIIRLRNADSEFYGSL